MTKFSLSAVTMVAALTLTAFSPASAAVLAEYDFGGSNGIQASNGAINIAANLQVSAFSRGAAYASPANSSAFGTNTIFTNPGSGLGTVDNPFLTAGYTLDQAIAGDAYFEFSITVEEGYVFNLTSIELGTRRASARSGPNHFVVRSSSDNYGSNLINPTSTADLTGNTSSSLTLDFGNLVQDASGTVTFRIYGFGRNETSATFGIFAISNPGASPTAPSGSKNFTINGSVTAIPEPSTIAFGVFGLGVVAFAARRRQAQR